MKSGTKDATKRRYEVMVGDEVHTVRNLDDCDYLLRWLAEQQEVLARATERAAEVRRQLVEGK